jgi:hypothetical protein
MSKKSKIILDTDIPKNSVTLDNFGDLTPKNVELDDNSIYDSASQNNQSGSIDNKLDQILKKLAYPEKHVLTFDSQVIKSTLYDSDPQTQIANTTNAYNQGRKTIMTSSVFGTRIEPDEFRLVALNKQPELVPPSPAKLRKQLFSNPNDNPENLGIYKQTNLFIGEYGSYIINVPMGYIAKAWKGNMPIFLGQGPHVIHDPNLKTVKKEDLIDMNSDYIQHGTYHIIRVPPGQFAKITINTTPYFLTPRNHSYVFNESVFKFDGLVKLSSVYIAHGNYNILQIPHGKIAKVWFGATRPELLNASDIPYVFADPAFSLALKNKDTYFEDATEHIIIHGSIKRILPKTGEVAVTHNNGKLVTYCSNPKNEPITITEPNHSFDRFIPINIQTIEFPSEKKKNQRIKENNVSKKDIDYADVNYEVFRTSDGLPIGVKLLVVYEIENPNLTLQRLNADQILSHIESLVVADMGLVIQNCSSVDFLKTNQAFAKKEVSDVALNVNEFYENLQKRVFSQLQNDFADYGIKLIRLNIETPKILDLTIAGKMAEFSLMNTEARAKEGVLDRKFNIAKQEASQDAIKKQISQEQENNNEIAKAKAKLEAAKLLSQAALAQVEADAQQQKMLLEIAERRAKLYDDHPGLLQYDIAKIQAEAMKNITSTIISPEIASMYYGFPNLMKQSNAK